VPGGLQAVFFDLDDTLCDTDGTVSVRFQAGLRALTQVDRRWSYDDLMARVFDRPKDSRHWPSPRLPRFLEELGVAGTPAAQAALKAHDAALLAHIRPMPGVPGTLEELAQGLTLGVVTNGPGLWQREKLQAAGLVTYFTILLISEEVGWSKPDPRIFQAALAQARCPAERALFCGDRWRIDIQGASAVGMHTAWIVPDPSTQPPGPEATLVLPSVAHLPAALREQGMLDPR
jgi:HAD superfamily hydrolase (TIGR01509 family)